MCALGQIHAITYILGTIIKRGAELPHNGILVMSSELDAVGSGILVIQDIDIVGQSRGGKQENPNQSHCNLAHFFHLTGVQLVAEHELQAIYPGDLAM
jgi:hypothetical protein